MMLHSRIKGEELDVQRLSGNPLYTRDDEIVDVPKHQTPLRSRCPPPLVGDRCRASSPPQNPAHYPAHAET